MYHYNVMSFGLKNIETTYQRMMASMFKPLLGKPMAVYRQHARKVGISGQPPNHVEGSFLGDETTLTTP